jgi:hypothetical protein
MHVYAYVHECGISNALIMNSPKHRTLLPGLFIHKQTSKHKHIRRAVPSGAVVYRGKPPPEDEDSADAPREGADATSPDLVEDDLKRDAEILREILRESPTFV